MLNIANFWSLPYLFQFISVTSVSKHGKVYCLVLSLWTLLFLFNYKAEVTLESQMVNETTLYLPTLTPAGWKLRSHAGSLLWASFSCLIEKINVSCCRLAWHNFQKYVNSDPCKERKPCVKWIINDNTFLTISDFVDKRFLDNFAFGRLRTSPEDLGLLRKTWDFFGNLRKWSCRLQKS